MEKKKPKLNIVDIVVIVVILLAAAFFGWKLLHRGDDAKAPEKPGVIRFVVEVDALRRDMYDATAVTLPVQMAASGKLVDGFIQDSWASPVQLISVKAKSPVNASKEVELVPEEGVDYVNAYFLCECDVDLNNKLNLSGTQELRIGRSFYVKSVDFEFNGTIISLEKIEK